MSRIQESEYALGGSVVSATVDIFPQGRPKEKTAPSGGSAVRAATSVGVHFESRFIMK